MIHLREAHLMHPVWCTTVLQRKEFDLWAQLASIFIGQNFYSSNRFTCQNNHGFFCFNQQWTKWCCPFKEKQLTLLLIIKLELLKLECWKTYFCSHELDVFPIIGLIFTSVVIILLFSVSHQHLEGQHNSVKHFFFINQCLGSKNLAWVNFKVQGRPVDFSVTAFKNLTCQTLHC